MATKHNSAGNGWQAITQHPLFATIVPVWLAATFALSTLAIRGQLIERLVLSTQLDLILPMATPPLGTTARLLLALAFGLLGALLGWLVVRLLAARGPAAQGAWPQGQREAAPLRRRSADAHPDFPARQPIQAHAELGEHGFDDHPAPPAPEKPSAPQVSENARKPSYAPPPPVAESWQVLHEVPAPPAPAEEPSWDWKPTMAPPAAATVAQPAVSQPAISQPAVSQPAMIQPAPAAPPAPFETIPQWVRAAMVEPVNDMTHPADEVPADKPFRSFHIEPAPVAPAVTTLARPNPLASLRPEAPLAAPAAQPVMPLPLAASQPVAEPVFSEPRSASETPAASPAKALAGFPVFTLEGPSAAEQIASASLESLSHVELLARLAQALNRHHSAPNGTRHPAAEPTMAPAPDGTGDALRAALASLRDVK